MTDSKRLASLREAVEYAGVTERTIARWRQSGRLKTYESELGGGPGRPRIHVDLDEIDDLTRPVAS